MREYAKKCGSIAKLEKVLTPGVNFINILCEAFTGKYPKCPKRSQVVSLFVLFGSSFEKTVQRMLMKLTPEVDFTNIFARLGLGQY